MLRRPPRSTRTDTLFPTRRSSDLYVVEWLKAKGAVFVEHLDDVPDDFPVIFSAHGVPKSVPEAASARGLEYLDATCPLVSKVHRQAEKMVTEGRHILFVGPRGQIGRASCRARGDRYV